MCLCKHITFLVPAINDAIKRTTQAPSCAVAAAGSHTPRSAEVGGGGVWGLGSPITKNETTSQPPAAVAGGGGRGRVLSGPLFIAFGCAVPCPLWAAQILNSDSHPLTRCRMGESRQVSGAFEPSLKVFEIFFPPWLWVEVGIVLEPHKVVQGGHPWLGPARGTCRPQHETRRSPVRLFPGVGFPS